MISMRRRLLLMLALILLVTQLISAFWLWHESQEQIGFWWTKPCPPKGLRTERVDSEIAEAIASLLAPSLIMMIVTLLASFWAISWIIRPLNQLQKRLEKRSADNLTPLPIASDSQGNGGGHQCTQSAVLTIGQHHSTGNACSPPTPPTSCARRWPASACIWN